jgi:pimeloyl-ACP methyl ester carboxylesterase
MFAPKRPVSFVAEHGDKRVKAIVAQAPSAMNWETRRGIDPERFDKVGELLIQDRIERHRTGTINYINVVAPEGESCVLSQPKSHEFMMKAGKHAPNWRNQITFESLEKQREFDPISLIHLITPTPLLIIAAEHDTLIPLDAPVSAYQRALEPKSLKKLPCGHFDVYTEPWIGEAARAAVDWFTSHL